MKSDMIGTSAKLINQIHENLVNKEMWNIYKFCILLICIGLNYISFYTYFVIYLIICFLLSFINFNLINLKLYFFSHLFRNNFTQYCWKKITTKNILDNVGFLIILSLLYGISLLSNYYFYMDLKADNNSFINKKSDLFHYLFISVIASYLIFCIVNNILSYITELKENFFLYSSKNYTDNSYYLNDNNAFIKSKTILTKPKELNKTSGTDMNSRTKKSNKSSFKMNSIKKVSSDHNKTEEDNKNEFFLKSTNSCNNEGTNHIKRGFSRSNSSVNKSTVFFSNKRNSNDINEKNNLQYIKDKEISNFNALNELNEKYKDSFIKPIKRKDKSEQFLLKVDNEDEIHKYKQKLKSKNDVNDKNDDEYLYKFLQQKIRLIYIFNTMFDCLTNITFIIPFYFSLIYVNIKGIHNNSLLHLYNLGIFISLSFNTNIDEKEIESIELKEIDFINKDNDKKTSSLKSKLYSISKILSFILMNKYLNIFIIVTFSYIYKSIFLTCHINTLIGENLNLESESENLIQTDIKINMNVFEFIIYVVMNMYISYVYSNVWNFLLKVKFLFQSNDNVNGSKMKNENGNENEINNSETISSESINMKEKCKLLNLVRNFKLKRFR